MVKKLIFNQKSILLIRLIMGIVFIYASYSKIIDPLSFSQNIHNYGVTPLFIENIIALTLPWVELFIGLGLILNIKYDACLDIAIFLMALFIILISQAYLRGKSIDCGCFSNDLSAQEWGEKRWSMLKRIFEDIVFLILLITLKFNSISNKD
tara:strand:- start:2207 stop:2662 length:456 start_codon:yes stop_codon:yes gene_type:complete